MVSGMNHYWSSSGALVVGAQSTSGQRTKQYSFVHCAIEEHRTTQAQKSPARRSKARVGGDAMSLFNVCTCLLLQGFEVTIQLTNTLKMLCLTLLLVVERVLRLRMLEGERMRHLTCMIEDRVFVHSENKV